MGDLNKPKRSHSLSFKSNRRFGIELEVNADDGIARGQGDPPPTGIDRIATLVKEAAPDMDVSVRGYEHTNNNKGFILKPDSSCGIEICTPPARGWRGLKKTMKVVDRLKEEGDVKIDNRCSVHVHLEIADLTREQVATIVAWWIKCEMVFVDAMPTERKRNKYCQLLCMMPQFQHNGKYTHEDILRGAGDFKYYTCNVNMYLRNSRNTIEFRIVEGEGCLDSTLIKNWVRLLIHFVERVKDFPLPVAYKEFKNENERLNITPWTGLSWLDPKHVFAVLGFNTTEADIYGIQPSRKYKLSKALTQTRDWYTGRLYRYMSQHKKGEIRHVARQEIEEIAKQLIEHEDWNEKFALNLGADALYGDHYIF